MYGVQNVIVISKLLEWHEHGVWQYKAAAVPGCCSSQQGLDIAGLVLQHHVTVCSSLLMQLHLQVAHRPVVVRRKDRAADSWRNPDGVAVARSSLHAYLQPEPSAWAS